MKFKTIILSITVICVTVFLPVTAAASYDEEVKDYLLKKYDINASSYRPVIQVFEDGSRSFVCDKIELDYYYTLLQDDLDEGIDNYQNYAYLIDTSREKPVVRTNRYDMKGVLRPNKITMPILDVSRPKRFPFKVRSLKKDVGLTQWYIDVNDDFKGLHPHGKGMVGYDIYLSPFQMENDDHNNLIFKEIVDVEVSVIRPIEGKEPEIKRYSLSKTKPKIQFEGGTLEVTSEGDMKHIRLKDEGRFGYGQLKFEVEGSSATIAKDSSKPLNNLTMGVRGRFEIFDERQPARSFEQLEDVIIPEIPNTAMNTMMHHVYSDDRLPHCSLENLKKKHDDRMMQRIDTIIARFNQLPNEEREALRAQYNVKNKQELAELIDHYDLNIYSFKQRDTISMNLTVSKSHNEPKPSDKQNLSPVVAKQENPDTDSKSKHTEPVVEVTGELDSAKAHEEQLQSAINGVETKIEVEEKVENVLNTQKESDREQTVKQSLDETQLDASKQSVKEVLSNREHSNTNTTKPVSDEVEPKVVADKKAEILTQRQHPEKRTPSVKGVFQSHAAKQTVQEKPNFNTKITSKDLSYNTESVRSVMERAAVTPISTANEDGVEQPTNFENRVYETNGVSEIRAEVLQEDLPRNQGASLDCHVMAENKISNPVTEMTLEPIKPEYRESEGVVTTQIETPIQQELPHTGVTETSTWLLGSILCILGMVLRRK